MQNNPLRYTDPTGHATFSFKEAQRLQKWVGQLYRAAHHYLLGTVTKTTLSIIMDDLAAQIAPFLGSVGALYAGAMLINDLMEQIQLGRVAEVTHALGFLAGVLEDFDE